MGLWRIKTTSHQLDMLCIAIQTQHDVSSFWRTQTIRASVRCAFITVVIIFYNRNGPPLGSPSSEFWPERVLCCMQISSFSCALNVWLNALDGSIRHRVVLADHGWAGIEGCLVFRLVDRCFGFEMWFLLSWAWFDMAMFDHSSVCRGRLRNSQHELCAWESIFLLLSSEVRFLTICFSEGNWDVLGADCDFLADRKLRVVLVLGALVWVDFCGVYCCSLVVSFESW